MHKKYLALTVVIILSIGASLDNLPGTGDGYFVSDNYFGMHIHNAEKNGNWPVLAFDSWRLWDAHVSWPHLQPKKTNGI